MIDFHILRLKVKKLHEGKIKACKNIEEGRLNVFNAFVIISFIFRLS